MLSDFLYLVLVLISGTDLYKLFVHVFKICHNPKHTLYSDLPGLFRPVQITRGALSFINFDFLLWDLTLLSSPEVLLQLSLGYGMIFLIML